MNRLAIPTTSSDLSASTRPVARAGSHVTPVSRLRDVLVLTKARVNVAVVGTTVAGFALSLDPIQNWPLLVHAAGGTALVACGAAAANQTIEQPFDKLMARTRNRPLARGRFSRATGGMISGFLTVLGVAWLGVSLNVTAAFLAFLAFALYAFAYTPLKRVSPACVFIGAIPGALPLLVGWAATGTRLGVWPLTGFLLLLAWQVPHFAAIAWRHRSEYRAAGFAVLPRNDRGGVGTAAVATGFSVALIPIAWIPAAFQTVHPAYLAGSTIVCGAFSWCSMLFLQTRDRDSASRLFRASLLHLPAMYLLMFLGHDASPARLP